MNISRRILSSFLLGTAMSGIFFISSSIALKNEDPWVAIRPIAGTWKGIGTGFGGTTDVTHEWEFIFHDKFVRLRTKSIPRSENKSDEVHEDVGFISHNKDSGTFVFRQFLSEGFVNTFDMEIVTDDTLTILFNYRDSESAFGMRAQMRLSLLSEDEYEMTLDLASPGKEFTQCQRMVMKRVD